MNQPSTTTTISEEPPDQSQSPVTLPLCPTRSPHGSFLEPSFTQPHHCSPSSLLHSPLSTSKPPLPTPQRVSPPLPTSVPRGSHYRPKLPCLPLVSRPPRSLRSAPGSPPEARLLLRSLLRLPRSAAPPPRSPDRTRRSAHRAPRSERAQDPRRRGAGAVTATATAQGLRGRGGAAELNTASAPTEGRCGRARLPHLIRACDLSRALHSSGGGSCPCAFLPQSRPRLHPPSLPPARHSSLTAVHSPVRYPAMV